MKQTDKVWLAATLDCDGMIGPRIRNDDKFYPRLFFGNTSLALVKEFAQITASKIRKEKKRPNRKTYYTVTISEQKKILFLLREILPYLIGKKLRAKQLITRIGNKKWRGRYGKSSPRREYNIIEGYRKGYTYKELAKRNHVTTATVFNVLKRNSTVFNRLTPKH